MIDLDELERLEEAATPGEWRDILSQPGVRHIDACEHGDEIAVLYGGDGIDGDYTNAALIVAMRNALPGLLRELRAAGKAVHSMRYHAVVHMPQGRGLLPRPVQRPSNLAASAIR